MSSPKLQKWIVKDAEGKIYGPFTTEQVLEQIDRNYFLGGELVASYPGGNWIPISKAPDFYDRLLDVLAAEVKHAANAAPPPPIFKGANNEPKKPPQPTNVQPSFVPPKLTVAPVIEEPEPEEDDDEYEDGTSTSASPVIELTDLKAFEKIQRLKESKKPMMMIVAALVAVAVAFFLFDKEPAYGKRIHLLAPKKNQPELADTKLREKFQRAIASFQTDTFEGYQKASNELVELVEGASRKPEAQVKRAEYLSFLCLTYRELWPFAYQDTKDLRVISETMQEAKRYDPGGLHGSLCELVQLIVNGRARDAQGLAESVLLEKSQAPVLFEIRGDIYMQEKDYQNAVGYFSQARALWPGWQKSSVQQARALSELKKFEDALPLFREVLGKVPDHGVAKIELGLIEALHFNQFDKGFSLIKQGVEEQVPRTEASRGYLGLATIYVRQSQQSGARAFAKQAYEADPSNKEAKEMLIVLGSTGVQPDGPSLMYTGDQYMKAGDYFSAQAQFKAAFDSNPKNGIAAMKAGKCLWMLNQSADAIEWMKKAYRADKTLIAAYVELADYQAQRYDYYAAMESLKAAQAVQPNSYEVYRGFAMVEFRRNNFAGAIGFGARAMKLYPTDLDTLLLMAKSHIGLMQYPEALKYAARARDLDFNNTEAQSVYAKVEAGLRGVESAVGYIQDQLNKFVITQGKAVPQAAIDLRITLGEIYLQDERLKQAEDVFRQAVALDPNTKRGLIALAKVLQRESQASEALELFLRAAVMDPSDAEPIFFSGQLYSDLGKFGEAAHQFERVLRINPRYPRAHVQLGRVALKRGDSKKALEEALAEKAINPDLAEAFILAAEAFFNLRQFSNCAGEYQKAVAKHGQNALVLVRMSRCYRLSGALESAQSILRQAVATESGNPDIYKEQGALFHVQGRSDEAIGAYDTYIRLAPNAIDRSEIEGRIRKIQSGDLSIE